jgi:3-deoxy-7-phosphoheptulonate synthase
MELPTPARLKQQYPLSPTASCLVRSAREQAESILLGKDPRLVAIVGPCSVHEPRAVLEYAQLLKALSEELKAGLFLILRLFIEKPRTQIGWKGIIYDPHLNGSDEIAIGLQAARKLFLELAEEGVPCATELLEPLLVPYFDDLIVWGMIGARTSASQPHRQMASGLPFPVGFKNNVQGEIDEAVAGVLSSQRPHSHIGINSQGRITAIRTTGNPFSHLVLRGSEKAPNYDPDSLRKAEQLLLENQLPARFLIDCSHGNSGKDPQKQPAVLQSVMEQWAEGKGTIFGFMLESHLFAGKQPLKGDPSSLRYGVSITDACLGWKETESILLWAFERSMSMSSVQN